MERMRLDKLSEKIPVLFSVVKMRQENFLDRLQHQMTSSIINKLTDERHHLERIQQNLPSLAERFSMKEQHRLEMLTQRLKAVDPQNVLKRGYSITLHNGKTVRNIADLKVGDVIETRVEKGSIKSEVK